MQFTCHCSQTFRASLNKGEKIHNSFVQAANEQIELDIESISHQHCLALGRTSSEADGQIDHQKHFPPSLN
jgi:hypothetical protein